MYHIHGEIFYDTDLIRLDPFQKPIPLYADVLLEYPSPWYTNQELDDVIKQAKDKKAKIALDLTWLPVATDEIKLDLNGIDQIFFSMNKAWPIHDLRPAFRWSRERINDRQTFDYEIGMYPKTSVNMFMKLIDKFSFGVGSRHTSIRIPNQTEAEEKGYFEDRRPSSSLDPYVATALLFSTSIGMNQEHFR